MYHAPQPIPNDPGAPFVDTRTWPRRSPSPRSGAMSAATCGRSWLPRAVGRGNRRRCPLRSSTHPADVMYSDSRSDSQRLQAVPLRHASRVCVEMYFVPQACPILTFGRTRRPYITFFVGTDSLEDWVDPPRPARAPSTWTASSHSLLFIRHAPKALTRPARPRHSRDSITT